MDDQSTPAVDRRATRGGVVLCGGGSVRMGVDKAKLPFGPGETMLQRVVRLMSAVVPVENIVVVAARRQTLPPLPAEVLVIRDEQEDRGPLPALIAGLSAIQDRAAIAFVTACDAPLLLGAVVERLLGIMEDSVARAPRDVVVPADVERLYPLEAVYATSAAPALRRAWDAGCRSLQGALNRDDLAVHKIPLDELKAVCQDALVSLANCNTFEEYLASLAAAGFSHRCT